MNVLVVGGSGGIGAALVSAYAADQAVQELVATRRGEPDAQSASASWLALDLCRQDSIERAGKEIRSAMEHLDLVIFASGVLQSDSARAEKSLEQIRLSALQASSTVNALGPLCMLAELAAPLRASTAPKVVFLSAQIGSIEDNGLGGWYGYRMAKAALNMGVKTAAIEVSRWRNDATLVALHPGTTLTKLSEPFVRRRRKPPASAPQAAEKIAAFVRRMTPDMNGGFYRCDGCRLPW